MIHIVNGEEWGERLRTWTRIEGEVFVWREMMDFGPFSRDWTIEERIRHRAAFFEERIGFPREQMEMICRYQEQRLERIPPSTSVALWYNSDRYDQLTLLYLAVRIRQLGLKSVFLVEVPQRTTVTEADLNQLWDGRWPMEERELERAEGAWDAFVSPTPIAVHRWLREELFLFHLHDAFRCHLEYLPSERNGLNRVEEQALRLVQEGYDDFYEIFQRVAAERPRDGLTDVHFAAILNELTASEGRPLLDTNWKEGSSPDRTITDGPIRLTSEGEAVLAGEVDRVDILGMDWWWGGTRLVHGRWRLNAEGTPVEWKG
ncbi:DUF1835 domain-containing protein [Desmospora profundinema]|uniref:DUF1835 domain-containing protein n=1 Tax=Desmospora profundinema TaxID=1571184 RepID=A0ABU1IM53_9BACL|nr:DUF1835 domain-containing protein [Desmospora profundinema]MDR6225855.1 hypothetical protein [Desmospora profundinema]